MALKDTPNVISQKILAQLKARRGKITSGRSGSEVCNLVYYLCWGSDQTYTHENVTAIAAVIEDMGKNGEIALRRLENGKVYRIELPDCVNDDGDSSMAQEDLIGEKYVELALKYADLKEKNSHDRSRLKKAAQDESDTRGRYKILEGENANLKQRNANLRKTNARLKARLESETDASLMQKIQGLESTNARLLEDMDSGNKKIAKLEATLRETEAAIKQKESTIAKRDKAEAELKREVEKLKSEKIEAQILACQPVDEKPYYTYAIKARNAVRP